MSVLVKLSEEQQGANDYLYDWTKKPVGEYTTLGGLAGTGKTTILGFFRVLLHANNPKLTVAFCCYTGKASRVLYGKLREAEALYGMDTCSTIHGLIYRPEIHPKTGEVIRWHEVDSIECDLVIVDEASMVPQKMFNHLLAYNVPIICVGDHGQLPSFGGDGVGPFNLMDNPDLKLEKIHRQAEGNPVIKMAHLVRDYGNSLECGQWGDKVWRLRRSDSRVQEFVDKIYRGFDPETMVLCGSNRERVSLNKRIRRLLGFTSPGVWRGERVLCLRNNWQAKDTVITNGMTGTVKAIQRMGDDHYRMEVDMDGEERNYKGRASVHMFDNEKGTIPEHMSFKNLGDQFDRGYTLTVHKAQGSEARRVVVYERPKWFSEDEELYRRWLYTAVTRTKEELYVVV